MQKILPTHSLPARSTSCSFVFTTIALDGVSGGEGELAWVLFGGAGDLDLFLGSLSQDPPLFKPLGVTGGEGATDFPFIGGEI